MFHVRLWYLQWRLTFASLRTTNSAQFLHQECFALAAMVLVHVMVIQVRKNSFWLSTEFLSFQAVVSLYNITASGLCEALFLPDHWKLRVYATLTATLCSQILWTTFLGSAIRLKWIQLLANLQKLKIQKLNTFFNTLTAEKWLVLQIICILK